MERPSKHEEKRAREYVKNWNNWNKLGRLTILKEAEKYVSPSWRKHRQVLCKCDCGVEKIVRLWQLRNWLIKSCWCYNKEKVKEMATRHGMYWTKTYYTRRDMKSRCRNKNNKYYKNYWWRGITYDPRWEKFESFYEDMWPCPEWLTLERKNNDWNYNRKNCCRDTAARQNKNKRNNVLYQGKCIAERAREKGIKYNTLQIRIKRWRSREKALNTPVKIHR